MSVIERNQFIHDKAAFVVGIYDTHMKHMFGTAMKVSANEADARDLVDTTVANLFVSDLSNFPIEDDKQKRYLAAAVKNARITELQLTIGLTASAIKKGITVESLYSDRQYSYAAPDSTEDTALAVIEIEEIISEIASSDRTTRNRARIELLRGFGFTQGEIAQIEMMPEGTVKSRIFRSKVDRTDNELVHSKPVQSVGEEVGHDAITLTPRCAEVMQLMSKGFSNKQITKKLNISDGTLNFYQNSIYETMNVHSQEAALFMARKHGIIDVSEVIANFSLDRFKLLSHREKEVIAFVYENIMGDSSNISLARYLGVSTDAAAKYMPRIQKKLQVANRFQVALLYELYNSGKNINGTATQNEPATGINSNHYTVEHNFYKRHSDVAA